MTKHTKAEENYKRNSNHTRPNYTGKIFSLELYCRIELLQLLVRWRLSSLTPPTPLWKAQSWSDERTTSVLWAGYTAFAEQVTDYTECLQSAENDTSDKSILSSTCLLLHTRYAYTHIHTHWSKRLYPRLCLGLESSSKQVASIKAPVWWWEPSFL